MSYSILDKSVSTLLLLPEIIDYVVPYYLFPRELFLLIVSFMQPPPFTIEEHKNGVVSQDKKSSTTSLNSFDGSTLERYARSCKIEPRPNTKVKFSASNLRNFFSFGISNKLITSNIGLFTGLGSYQSQREQLQFYYYCDGRTNNDLSCTCNCAYEDTNYFELHFNSDSTFTLLINNVIQPTNYEIPKEFYIYFGLYNAGSVITLSE